MYIAKCQIRRKLPKKDVSNRNNLKEEKNSYWIAFAAVDVVAVRHGYPCIISSFQFHKVLNFLYYTLHSRTNRFDDGVDNEFHMII